MFPEHYFRSLQENRIGVYKYRLLERACEQGEWFDCPLCLLQAERRRIQDSFNV
jgi:hypothetical protein